MKKIILLLMFGFIIPTGCEKDGINKNNQETQLDSEAYGYWEKHDKSGYIYLQDNEARFCHAGKKTEFIGTFNPKDNTIEIDLSDGYIANFEAVVNGDEMILVQYFSDNHTTETQYYKANIYPCGGVGETDEGTGNGGWIETGYISENEWIYKAKLNNDGSILSYLTNNNNIKFYINNGGWKELSNPISIPGGYNPKYDISDDGTTLVYGWLDDTGWDDKVIIKILKWSGSQWLPKGNEISLVEWLNDDFSGWNLDISGDGNNVVFSAPGFSTSEINGADNNAGMAKIFAWNGSQWLPKGQLIPGKATNERLGIKCLLSNSGDVLAISYLNSNKDSTWGIRAFEFVNNSWVQMGGDFVESKNSSASPQSGNDFDISSDGNTIVAGISNKETINGYRSGAVEVYKFTGNSWSIQGESILGDGREDYFGSGVSLSSSGNTFFAYARNPVVELGHEVPYANVYQWSNSGWIQEGSNFPFSEVNHRLYPRSIAFSLSGNANSFMVGTTIKQEGQVEQPTGIAIFSKE